MQESDSKRLFHFTKEEAFFNILKAKEFWVSYSLEDYNFLNEGFLTPENLIRKFAVPMTCFCDTPIERHEQMKKWYGEFIIGMKKEWGEKNGLSPVQYLNKGATSISSWYNILSQLNNIQKEMQNSEMRYSFLYDIIKVATYLKPYSGIIRRENFDRFFYDEREWRFVPKEIDPLDKNTQQKLYMSEDDFIEKEAEKSVKKDILKSQFKLDFEWSDIDCVIVPEDSCEMVKGLNLNDNVQIKTYSINA